jgi:urease accessory protein UreH
VVLGRAARAERVIRGQVRLSLALSHAGRLLWEEQMAADAADRLFASPLGWGGRIAACTVWACGPESRVAELLSQWRALMETGLTEPAVQRHRLTGAATSPTAGLLLARLLADDAQPLMHLASGSLGPYRRVAPNLGHLRGRVVRGLALATPAQAAGA